MVRVPLSLSLSLSLVRGDRARSTKRFSGRQKGFLALTPLAWCMHAPHSGEQPAKAQLARDRRSAEPRSTRLDASRGPVPVLDFLGRRLAGPPSSSACMRSSKGSCSGLLCQWSFPAYWQPQLKHNDFDSQMKRALYKATPSGLAKSPILTP